MARKTIIDKEIESLDEETTLVLNFVIEGIKTKYCFDGPNNISQKITDEASLNSWAENHRYWVSSIDGGLASLVKKWTLVRNHKYTGDPNEIWIAPGRISDIINNFVRMGNRNYTTLPPEIKDSRLWKSGAKEITRLIKRYGRVHSIGRGYYSSNFLNLVPFKTAADLEEERINALSKEEQLEYFKERYLFIKKEHEEFATVKEELEHKVVVLSDQIAATQRIGWH